MTSAAARCKELMIKYDRLRDKATDISMRAYVSYSEATNSYEYAMRAYDSGKLENAKRYEADAARNARDGDDFMKSARNDSDKSFSDKLGTATEKMMDCTKRMDAIEKQRADAGSDEKYLTAARQASHEQYLADVKSGTDTVAAWKAHKERMAVSEKELAKEMKKA